MPARTPRAAHPPVPRTLLAVMHLNHVSHRPSPETRFPQAFAEATSFYKTGPENEGKPSFGEKEGRRRSVFFERRRPETPRAAQRVGRDASCGKVRRPLENNAGTENAVEQLFGLFDSLWNRIVDRDIRKRR